MFYVKEGIDLFNVEVNKDRKVYISNLKIIMNTDNYILNVGNDGAKMNEIFLCDNNIISYDKTFKFNNCSFARNIYYRYLCDL